MGTDIDTLEERYFSCCERIGVPPNKAILASIFKAKIKKARREVASLVFILDDLKDTDFQSLFDLLVEIDNSEIDAVDIICKSSCNLNGVYVLKLLRAMDKKLRVVDIHDVAFGKDFLLDLAQQGLPCQVLNLRSSHFRKLNMIGNFMVMHTLNLDFSLSLSSFREDCFTCMPNLRFLSLCETRIANLWTTSAALARLPSLVELRFQNCQRCSDAGCCPASTDNKVGNSTDAGLRIELPLVHGEEYLYANIDDEDINNYDFSQDIQGTTESSDDSEVDFSGHHQDLGLSELFPQAALGWNELFDLHSEISLDMFGAQDEAGSSPASANLRHYSDTIPRKYISHHPSPICYEKNYREYMIASLPNLKILDNLPIGKAERKKANDIFSHHFEHLPYNRSRNENVLGVLQKREIRAYGTCTSNSRQKFSSAMMKSQYFYSRSLSAAKVGSSAWPALHPLSFRCGASRDEKRNFRPRQFEYHPTDPRLMVFGTLDGDVVVINHENGKIVNYIPSLGATNSVLGLCWLKTYPSKLIAGSDSGSLRLYDIQHIPKQNGGTYCYSGSVTFDEFDQLTSVHVNSTDELFLASGYSKHVALYDIGSGRRMRIFADMHQEHINVVKFSNHSPSIFATSSFDRDIKLWDLRQKPHQPCYTASSSRGNVMVCFSPDDYHLLVSAVDNEVKQLLAVDGRLHLDFGIAATGSSQNYTRSYYMNGRDYVISGSCDEHVVRICCARTGRRLRDVSLEGKGSGASMFVQSLRGDPFRDFNMSILAAYIRPSSNSEIVKVNLLASGDSEKVHSSSQQSHPVNGMGG